MIITTEILTEFKERMHLGDYEDDNLRSILSASYEYFERFFTEKDLSKNSAFKTLVFERSRYTYNDALEYFNKNFEDLINDALWNQALDEIVLEEGGTDETV